jgi:hypothetical protein
LPRAILCFPPKPADSTRSFRQRLVLIGRNALEAVSFHLERAFPISDNTDGSQHFPGNLSTRRSIARHPPPTRKMMPQPVEKGDAAVGRTEAFRQRGHDVALCLLVTLQPPYEALSNYADSMKLSSTVSAMCGYSTANQIDNHWLYVENFQQIDGELSSLPMPGSIANCRVNRYPYQWRSIGTADAEHKPAGLSTTGPTTVCPKTNSGSMMSRPPLPLPLHPNPPFPQLLSRPRQSV